MFARFALRLSQMPLTRSPFARPESLITRPLPGFRLVAAVRKRARSAGRERNAPTLYDTALVLRAAAFEAFDRAQRRSHVLSAASSSSVH